MELQFDVWSHDSFVAPMCVLNQLRIKDNTGDMRMLPPEVIRQIVK
jgi:hypothetical protein